MKVVAAVVCCTLILFLLLTTFSNAKLGRHVHRRRYKGKFVDFVPDDKTQTCSHDKHTTPFNKQVRGTNLGGWLVLEPWITPSLFYQFLSSTTLYGDEAPERTGIDIHSFCIALGPEEANRQLRIHWKKFVTEEDIKKLASYGVNSLRIPVGDWMFHPYEPYIGCTDGSLEELDRAIALCRKYGIDVLIDIHGHKGSQNGFDNSGMSHKLKWTSIASSLPLGTTTFEHWPIRTAEWIGTFDRKHRNYSTINHENIQRSLDTIQSIAERYKGEPALLGLQPVNEPWEYTPLDILKDFYWEGYKIVKSINPSWKYVMHDSFRFGTQFWGGFMQGCPDRAIDTHTYQAWNNPGTHEDFFSNACQQKYMISKMEQTMMPVIVGEWSLATDNCAMWLNGFNDNLPGFPKVQCTYIPCPDSYLGNDFPGLPLDKTKPIQGPFGTGTSGPTFGMCPVGQEKSFDLNEDEMFQQLAYKKLNAFNLGHGWYFWNFKTELDIKWDFIRAVEKGWFPKNVSDPGEKIDRACETEDKGEFLCLAKPGVSKRDLKMGLHYACKNGVNCDGLEQQYPILEKRCDYVFNLYWHNNRDKGATCDFGGAAQLKTPVTGAGLPPMQYHITMDSPILQVNDEKKEESSRARDTFREFTLIASMILLTIAITFKVARRRRAPYSNIK